MQKFFYHHSFFVERGVFLPRFETEELVSLLLLYAPLILPAKTKVLEIGVGSGVILTSLALAQSHWQFSGIDIADNALKLTKKNLTHYHLSAKLWKSNLFSDVKEKYHLIVANLPYINFHQTNWDKTILHWDPPEALFASNCGLKILEAFFQNVASYLEKQYLIGLEIGINQSLIIKKFAKHYLNNYHLFFKKDLNNIVRFVFIYSF